MPSMYKTYDIDPIDVDPDGIAENQTTGAAANLTLDGALCNLGTAGVFNIYDAGYSTGIGGVRIAIDSAGDVSGITFTVTGTDQDGNAATEDITGVTTTAVESNTYWKTITQIAADGEVTSNVFVGPVDEVVTNTYPLNWHSHEPATVVVHSLSGTCQFDIDETFTEVRTVTDSSDLVWINNQANKSAGLVGELTLHAQAVRLVFDSYSSGAELQFVVTMNPWP
jgi:hypothetical protein